MDPFLAEIRMFGGNFAPVGWALCNGQIMAIAQNTALFSLLGTTFGGNGTTTFALPNLQGIAAMMWGSGPGLSPRTLGESGGSRLVTLTQGQMPGHAHGASGDTTGGSSIPTGNTWGTGGRGRSVLYASGTGSNVNMHAQALTPTGGGQPHNNVSPFQSVTFIIALQGIYPQRP